MPGVSRTYYHFTSIEAWGAIRSSQIIEPRWPADNLDRPDRPRVVCLTTSAVVLALPGSHHDRGVRVEVSLPEDEVVSHTVWLRQWFTAAAASVLSNQSVNLGGDPDAWHVIARGIPSSEWRSVMNIQTGSQLFP